MQSMRDLLRDSLRVSLNALSPTDRLAAAWPVAAGHAIAERSAVRDVRGTQAVVDVYDPGWLPTLRAATPQLAGDLARVSGIAVTDILFLAAARDATIQLPSRVGPNRNQPRSRS